MIHRLDYRPPLAWAALLEFLRVRAIPGLEQIEGDVYRRAEFSVRPSPDGAPALLVEIPGRAKTKLLLARVRALFDLDADPVTIERHLGGDELLATSIARRPGLRVPGSFDPFETGVRTILGQQVSVKAASTLCIRLVTLFAGFPSPAALADATVQRVRTIGLPESRARTLIHLARAIADQKLDLRAAADPAQTYASLLELPGIGPWTAEYLLMRALHVADAFPSSDLVVMKALGVKKAKAAEARSEPWRPWRAYAVMHLWAGSHSGG